MANPNNAIGTNAAFGGRTSPNAFNDVLGAFQGRGILSGWACSPDTGMTISLGGDGTTRDVAIAEDNTGNKTSVDNISGSPVSLTITAAPATQSRIDAVVVYVENPPQGSSTETDNYGAIGILDVQGATASTPIAPDDSDIRTAITADGASGATAYYVVLAYITVASGTTTITSGEIEAGESASLRSELTNIPDGSITGTKIAASTVTSNNIDWATIPQVNYSSTEQEIGTWIDGSKLYRRVISGTLQNTSYAFDSSNISIHKMSGTYRNIISKFTGQLGAYRINEPYALSYYFTSTAIVFDVGSSTTTGSNVVWDITIEYTKN